MHVLARFPNRKFVALNKWKNILESTDDYTNLDIEGAMHGVQRVVGYGGPYKDFIMTLFAI